MKKISLLTFFIFFFGSAILAQTTEDSVKAVVNKMFAGMKNSDAAMIRECFADSIIFQTIIIGKDGKQAVANVNANDFIASISKLPKGTVDERIVFDAVKTDGMMAIVWAPYKFYYNGKFSHCGVDNFTLVKFNGVWKIQYLVYSRKKGDCE